MADSHRGLSCFELYTLVIIKIKIFSHLDQTLFTAVLRGKYNGAEKLSTNKDNINCVQSI